MIRSASTHAILGGAVGGILGSLKYFLSASEHSTPVSELEQLLNYVQSKNNRADSAAIQEHLEALVRLEANDPITALDTKAAYDSYEQLKTLTDDKEVLQFASTRLHAIQAIVEENLVTG